MPRKKAAPVPAATSANPTLHTAVINGDTALVRKLLAQGHKVNARDIHSRTPLHLAVQLGFIAVVDVLLEFKAPIEAKDSGGDTALQLAVAFEDANIIDLLLRHKADVTVITKDNQDTLLHLAAYGDNVEILRMIFDTGKLDINKKNRSGETALHVAAGEGHVDNVRCLLGYGANTQLTNNTGETPLDYAEEYAAENSEDDTLASLLRPAEKTVDYFEERVETLSTAYQNLITLAEDILRTVPPPSQTANKAAIC